ncbi:hypothetical protein [Halalkalibacter hemicellulosilyticus]|uniref:Uncharacterized protein n=1 Tax=Halalkalibacter hemicellulosilyticusJCM 9152 TaxID=1236971 RepID=W4QLB9_9BACI|nr:hypothetical protein [Halalkalibacter hemicellulosilyticus]GAE32413.1 hypothetical protein JCM9152_3947 [Halalkalibacter hemicellulosilyticusJCM 9152]
MSLKDTLIKSNELMDFVESKGWSEEELAKVVNLLHSELGPYSFSADLPQFSTVE